MIPTPLLEAMPPTLTLHTPDGRLRYHLRLNGDSALGDGDGIRVPFRWKVGPRGYPDVGTLRFTARAAAVLITLPGGARWRWIHTILETKYAQPESAIDPSNELLVTWEDLRANVVNP